MEEVKEEAAMEAVDWVLSTGNGQPDVEIHRYLSSSCSSSVTLTLTLTLTRYLTLTNPLPNPDPNPLPKLQLHLLGKQPESHRVNRSPGISLG